MSKDTHRGTVQPDGTVRTLCGLTFPKAKSAWVFWGTCPKCAKVEKGKR